MENGQILHMREMYRKWMLQVKGSYRGQMQDGDHTDGHYITMFAEQLTRPFEVLVQSEIHYIQFPQEKIKFRICRSFVFSPAPSIIYCARKQLLLRVR